MNTHTKEFLVDEFSVYKKSALLLHSLHPNDCEWLLNKLPRVKSEKLRILLQEITDIGFESLDSDIHDVTNTFLNEKNEEEKQEIVIDYRIELINNITTDQITIILMEEPESAIALLLAIHNWNWSTSYLSGMSADSKDRIRQQMATLVGNIPNGIKDLTLQHISDEFNIIMDVNS
ncbi:hypothetical protein IMCC1989_1985 [gamma proteobacterium IMCC1989]|nr:hypothetical protein IMCC1989_1985 [gamma proteobacterium IMCC1989]